MDSHGKNDRLSYTVTRYQLIVQNSQLFGLSLKDSPLLQTSHGTEFTEFTNARTPSEHNSALHDVIPNPTSAQANNPTTAHCADLIPNHSQENVHFDFDFGELVQMPISDPNDPRPSQESSSLTRTSTTVCSMWAKEMSVLLFSPAYVAC
jgi:hypothetical protein